MGRLAIIAAVLASSAAIAVSALAALAIAAGPAAASSPTRMGGASRTCGKVRGTVLHAHDLGCATAHRIYVLDLTGRLPAGWTCSASLGRCAKGGLGAPEYFWWPPAA
jgi:hypothetical protein